MKKKNKYFNILSVVIVIVMSFFIISAVTEPYYAAEETNIIQKSIDVGGIMRSFWVYTPPHYDKQFKSLPVVMILHGSVADGKKIMNYTKFNKTAEKNDFIAVYPEKIDLIDWDLKPTEKNKEIIFINQLIDYLEKNYRVDKSKVYITGFSSGANLIMLLAGPLHNKIAAFAPVSGNVHKKFIPLCQTNKPISILMVNGTEDPYDKWDGDGGDTLSVKDSIEFWKKHDKCKGTGKETVFPHKESSEPPTTAKLIINRNYINKTEVSLLEIEGGGHTWPGSPTNIKTQTFLGKTNYDIEANDIIWDFFSRHKLSKN